ncbi:hypothetical protein [Nostoc sp. LEGE 12450]|uniref:hypothetical protein n=1 Tax=Nostoc sp. LEGE 12450 TaxID=1828643 RepID=UPI001881694A|nr:hypothetical protein [Nostoc sp. LEGE 12450]MBE8987847.1 hypothetical protein [Nostoc sp. LEGE 12450]
MPKSFKSGTFTPYQSNHEYSLTIQNTLREAKATKFKTCTEAQELFKIKDSWSRGFKPQIN